jgi:ferredoxin--NADP+ reductase
MAKLNPGDRIFLGNKPVGHYTLDYVQPGDDVIFFGTGTGEAPHNAMLSELLSKQHTGNILSATCVRFKKDLAYLDVHREVEGKFQNYNYVPLTTREPENLDSAHPDYTGKQYLQDFFQSGRLQSEFGFDLNPETTHVYMCGNPAMIGIPQKNSETGLTEFPKPTGMVELLTNAGLRADEPRNSGSIHFEKYW